MKKEEEKGLNSNTDFPKTVVSSLSDQIRQADTKAAGTITFLGIIGGILIREIDLLKNSLGDRSYIWFVVVIVSAVMLMLAFKAVIRVLYPRISKGSKEGMYYFKDILQNSKEEYTKKGVYMTNEGIARQLYSTSYALSKVLEAKFKALKLAMILTLIVLVWTIVVIILV